VIEFERQLLKVLEKKLKLSLYSIYVIIDDDIVACNDRCWYHRWYFC